MKKLAFCLLSLLLFPFIAMAQGPDIKYIADTLVIQAEGTFETDPDLATLAFNVRAQDKELKSTYDKASQAIQKITALAEKNGLNKEDVTSGVLTVTPYYSSGDKKKTPKYFVVQGHVLLKVRDFSRLGFLVEESVNDEIVDFRSLTYSLSDEEKAKQKASAEAMRRAMGRASAVLEQKGQKIGALRFANLDVRQFIGVSEITETPVNGRSYVNLVENRNELPMNAASVVESGGGGGRASSSAPVPLVLPAPQSITVRATVQCAFAIQ